MYAASHSRSPRSRLLLSFLTPLYCLVGGLLVGLYGGYQVGRTSHQNLNDLLSVGFTLTDQDGYEVERFEEGISTVPVWSYWTTRPKDKP